MKLRVICCFLLALLAQGTAAAALNVNLVTDEAEAVLAILTKKKYNRGSRKPLALWSSTVIKNSVATSSATTTPR